MRSTTSRSNERGAALMWVAGSMVALLAAAALAVDMGWYFLNASRLQRAADAAALAGVVHLPGFTADALTDAQTAATINGFSAGGVTGSVVADNKYEVTLTATVDTFFAKVLGFNSLPLSRTATAEYIKPVPMGSPYNSFGYGYDAAQSFWAAIQAPYTAIANGDPYATKCIKTTTQGNCTGGTNAGYRSGGYYYGLDVPTGKTSMTVQLYDAGFYDRSGFAETGDEQDLVDGANGGAIMNFQLRSPDATPSDPTDNPAVAGCSLTINPEASSGTYKNKWANLCTVPNPIPGIYVLQVWTTGNGGGSSHFSIKATSSGAQDVKVYGINDMSIFTNDAGGTGTATVHLAQIDPVHAGKKLQLKFFDPGEGSGTAYMTVKTPTGAIPTCKWYATDVDGNTTNNGSTGSCKIKTTNSGTALFNAQWVIVTIDISPTYTCTTNCWWTMDLELNTPHDRTTWEARVIGNPVRLVPNP